MCAHIIDRCQDAAVVTGGCLDQWALPLYDLVIEMINGASGWPSPCRPWNRNPPTPPPYI